MVSKFFVQHVKDTICWNNLTHQKGSLILQLPGEFHKKFMDHVGKDHLFKMLARGVTQNIFYFCFYYLVVLFN